MAKIGRYFAISPDTTPGGTPYDSLAAGVVPVPTTFWQVTGFSVDKGEVAIDREDLITIARGTGLEAVFKQAPSVTVRGRLFTGMSKKLALLAQGKPDVRTGVAPAPSNHVLDPLGLGDVALPAVHVHLYRDGLYERISGATLSRLTKTFGNDGEVTFEAVFSGLYRLPSGVVDFPAFTAFNDIAGGWVWNPRDSKVFLDGVVSPATGMRSYTLTIDNQLREPDWEWSRNVEKVTDNGKEYAIWWPQARRLTTRRTVTGNLGFSDVKVAQDRAHDLRRAQKVEVTSEGPLMATVPPARELIRITQYATQYTGGGAGDASRDDDIQTEYEYSAKVDDTAGRDLRIEFVDNAATAITI